MLPRVANEFAGKLIIAEHHLNGKYIGVLEDISKGVVYRAHIRILYVLVYPLQTEGVFFSNHASERKPFKFCSIEVFSLGDVNPCYPSQLPNPYKYPAIDDFTLGAYGGSVSTALSNAIYRADIAGHQKTYEILKRHKEERNEATEINFAEF